MRRAQNYLKAKLCKKSTINKNLCKAKYKFQQIASRNNAKNISHQSREFGKGKESYNNKLNETS